MDTDDLSEETYSGIIIEAEELSHDLTIHYGLLSDCSNNEAEYIDKSEELTKRIQKLNDNELEDFFWGNIPEKEKLNFTLSKILNNIAEIRKIPENKRHYD
jgi:hypothetical protein